VKLGYVVSPWSLSYLHLVCAFFGFNKLNGRVVDCLLFVGVLKHFIEAVDLVFGADGRPVSKGSIWLRGRLTICLAFSESWHSHVSSIGDIHSIRSLLLKSINILILIQFTHLIRVDHMLILNGDLLDFLDHFDHVIQDAVNLLMSEFCFTLKYFNSSVIFLTMFKEFIDELDRRIINEFPIFLLICKLLDPLKLAYLFSKQVIKALSIRLCVLLTQDSGLTM